MPTTTSVSPQNVPPSHARTAASLALPETGFVRESRLLVFLPFSHSTLWRRVAADTFPAPIKLSAGVTAWRVEDVRAWINAQGGGGRGSG